MTSIGGFIGNVELTCEADVTSCTLADDVVFMHHGRILEYQPAPEFFESPSSAQAQAYLEGKIVI